VVDLSGLDTELHDHRLDLDSVRYKQNRFEISGFVKRRFLIRSEQIHFILTIANADLRGIYDPYSIGTLLVEEVIWCQIGSGREILIVGVEGSVIRLLPKMSSSWTLDRPGWQR
jgi:hypothetical protein